MTKARQPPSGRGIFGGIEQTLDPIPPQPIPDVKDGHSDHDSWLQLFSLLFPSAHSQGAFRFSLGGSLDPSALQGNFRSRNPHRPLVKRQLLGNSIKASLDSPMQAHWPDRDAPHASGLRKNTGARI